MSKHQEGWKGFLELCFAAQDIKHFSTVLDLLLTMEEKENLAMRYLIIKELLQKKKTQREIAKQLDVSIAKITRGSMSSA